MMSLSDTTNEQFKPIAIDSLENFEEEVTTRTGDTQPDLNLFKALFDTPQFDDSGENTFKMLYEASQEEAGSGFQPLFGENKTAGKTEVPSDPQTSDDPEKSQTAVQSPEGAGEDPGVPLETPEEKGYQEGFDKGFEKGEPAGFEKGFEKGELQGIEQGEQKGLIQGEEQGMAQGLRTGEKKGEKEAKEAAREILASLEETLKTAENSVELLVDRYETDILSLIRKIVEKVLQAQFEMNDELVKPVIIDTLKKLVHPEEITLSISPDDYEYVEMVKEDFFDAIDSLTHVLVQSDPSLQRGGCKIETNTAQVSSDMASKLEEVYNAVMAVKG